MTDPQTMPHSPDEPDGVMFEHVRSGLRASVTVESIGSSFPDDGQAIAITVRAAHPPDGDMATAMMLKVDWQAPNDFDEGAALLGAGRIEVEEAFRGHGIGTLAAAVAIEWLRSLPSVPLSNIILAPEDATEDNIARRRRFYEKMGIRFSWVEEGVEGQATRMATHDLVANLSSWLER
ncbi:GNAT family N-acetyltransferase [Luteibacter pinisoli]|uniref:GNAT family N-acetyltransferase n=1 Tax=Luteibacter pinisoli TaxID=2589080 RepID=A0A4Y5Z681_9GAMM|nr:GNAT family N-acetyltransferase [Luteibacter pinisoli]QDE39853.1 GNAT family N-acetyltransferase [Luteibacter pinisoli]